MIATAAEICYYLEQVRHNALSSIATCSRNTPLTSSLQIESGVHGEGCAQCDHCSRCSGWIYDCVTTVSVRNLQLWTQGQVVDVRHSAHKNKDTLLVDDILDAYAIVGWRSDNVAFNSAENACATPWLCTAVHVLPALLLKACNAPS